MAQYHHGGSAFPRCNEQHEGIDYGDDGMTLRDWFAGQVLTGLYARPDEHGPTTKLEAAEIAYDMAEQMIAERRHRARLDRQGERSSG